MTQPLFLTRQEVAATLGMTERQAREILSAHGVKPVDLGKGRGHGLRWRTSAVIAVADALHDAAQAHADKPRRPRKLTPLRGRSAADLFAEFQGAANAPVQ